MTAVVLQARLDSRRLPGKSLLPLGGRPLIFRVMEALNQVACDLRVLACPEDCADAFRPLAEEAGFAVMPGSADDVLRRYGDAVRRFGIRRLIRATGDNPFVFADAAEALNRETGEQGADYGGYAALPYGAGVESVDAEALLRAERESSQALDREHVCPYLYTHPDRFLLHRPLAPRRWRDPALRITVDTQEDYDRAQCLYRILSVRESEPSRRYQGESVIAACREYQAAHAGTGAPV